MDTSFDNRPRSGRTSSILFARKVGSSSKLMEGNTRCKPLTTRHGRYSLDNRDTKSCDSGTTKYSKIWKASSKQFERNWTAQKLPLPDPPPPQKGGGGASWASSRPPRTRGAPRRRVRQGHPGKPRTRRSSAPPTRSPRAGLPPQRPARPREAVKACQKLGQVILSWLDHNAARCDWAETKHPLPSLPLNKGEGPKCVPPSSLGRVREGVFCLPRTRTALARISPRAHIPGRATGDFHWLWSPLNWLRSRNNMASLDDKLALFWRVRRAQVVDMNWIAQNGIGFASQECEWAGNHA